MNNATSADFEEIFLCLYLEQYLNLRVSGYEPNEIFELLFIEEFPVVFIKFL